MRGDADPLCMSGNTHSVPAPLPLTATVVVITLAGVPLSRRDLFGRVVAGAALGAVFPALGEACTAAAEPGIIRLDRNESAYGPSPKVIEAIRSSITLADRYPDGQYEVLADHIARFHSIQPDQVTLGAGSREVLRMVLEAFLPGNKRLVAASPTFGGLAEIAAQVGAPPAVSTPLTKRYWHDLNAMLAAAKTETSLIYICNPADPTGGVTPRKDIETFLNKLPPNATVVIDEAFHEYVGGTSEYASFVDHPVGDDRVIVLRTFSKIYGLPGLRVGYGVSSAQRAKALAVTRLPWDLNAIAARAAVAALDDQDYVRECAKHNTDDRQELYNQINARMLRGIDSLTNFVLLKTGLPAQQVLEHFRKHNVILGPFIPQMDKHVRVTIGTTQEMQEFWRIWRLLPLAPMAM